MPNDSDGNRTRVTAVKGRCLNRLTTEPYSHSFSLLSGNRPLYVTAPATPRAGLEPATTRLTAECSTIELSRIIQGTYPQNQIPKIFHPFSYRSFCNDNCEAVFVWLSPRPISTYQLNTLLCLHLKPIYLVVSKGPY